MSRLFIFLFFLLFIAEVKGQAKPKQVRFPTQHEFNVSEKNRNCIYQKQYSAIQRRSLFPFSSAATVQLVSFDNPPPDFTGRLPMRDETVDYSILKEIKSLSKQGIDSLTDILYNYGYCGKFTVADAAQCYIPRNAILFTDASGNAFAFIELCFECEGSKVSTKKIETGDFCTQKYQLLKSFFLQQGITLGTKKDEDTETQSR